MNTTGRELSYSYWSEHDGQRLRWFWSAVWAEPDGEETPVDSGIENTQAAARKAAKAAMRKAAER